MTQELPTSIRLRNPETFFAERGVKPPSIILRQSSLKFRPQPFSVGGKMASKLYQPEVQNVSLLGFLKNPLQPVVYGVSSQTDNVVSNFFAAFLLQKFCELTHSSNHVQWIRPDDKLTDDIVRPNTACLVISGLTPNTPGFRLSRVSDILDATDKIPRIVVMTGEDPITFFATRLFYKVDRVFFHDDESVNRTAQVI